jgi:hypothetical protein
MYGNINDYEQLVEEVYYEDGTVQKVGFQEGKWLITNEYERIAVSKKGFLLHLEYNESGQAHFYKLYLNFAEMAADDLDFCLLSKVAAVLGVKDYIRFLD